MPRPSTLIASLRAGTFRAFRHRNYRVFFYGQIVSLIGTWITTVASSWLVYRLTQSEFLLGVVGFAGQFPAFLLAPFAGVLVDRWNRQHVLLATQIASMAQSLTLATLALTGTISVWSICALSVFQAFVNAFDMPARQAFLNEIVDEKSDLPNAIALNSAMFNAARLVGPSIGGIIIAASNEGVCFLIDGISYLAVVWSLWSIRIPASRIHNTRHRVLDGLRGGFQYVRGHARIRVAILFVGAISLLGTPHIVLMPIFAREILHGGPGLLGALMAASGFGAVSGALYLASRRSIEGMSTVLGVSGFSLAGALALFAQSTSVWVSLLANMVSGAALITLLAGSNTIIQTLVEDSKRARVMSFYMMAFMGMMPLGSLASGVLAHHLSAPTTVFIGAACSAIVTAIFQGRERALRRNSKRN